ncbi:hypothetical protein ACTQ9L_02390 [Deinococcus wulumuqiensis]|uniref:hypothetical protein n=1 Tax=Deinococcus wulumuqiensis TaxID=980427 RepID=UPI00242F1DE0|nr:hypothetical protein [Deinococcus wulumuqiensis]
MMSPALFSVLALLGTPTPAPVTLGAQAGQTATLRVDLALRDTLLSREAPNLLTLQTPWGQLQTRPSGTAHRDPAYAGYFGQVRPMTLKVKVPAQVRAGRYAAQLTADLFVCDTADKLCTRRTLKLPVQLQVGKVARPGTLTLKDEHLRPARLRRGLTGN